MLATAMALAETAQPPARGHTYLFLSLCLLDIIPPHLDARGEDASGEISHVDTQEMGHLLGS